jgi:hypothetical protein
MLPVLHAECAQCSGLCCVLLPYSRVDGFGADKAGGTPCAHLASDDTCRIHDRLATSGWAGCVRFDCFGAGQQVTQVTYAGRPWRSDDNLAERGAVFTVMWHLHEMLALLDEARRRSSVDVEDLLEEVLAHTGGRPETLLAVDVDELRTRAGVVLGLASTQVRAAWPQAPDHTHSDLAGADLREVDLRGASLRYADLLGADLRGADARGALLDDVLFLSRQQRAGLRTD